MERKLYTKEEVIKFISEGKKMVLSAGENILDQLPKGDWIAGTSPYFMNTDAGICTENKIFVDDFTNTVEDVKIKKYNKNNIKNIAVDAFENGLTVLILSMDSDTLVEFSINSFNYEEIFTNPIVGFVAGCNFEELSKTCPKSYNGQTGEKYNEEAVAIHFKLPHNKVARTEIINLETIDENSPQIQFPKTSFIQSECTIDGKEYNIADFLHKKNYKENYPIIANYSGALINRDVKKIDVENGEVSFYAPVFSDETYYLANLVDNYQELFINKASTRDFNITYSCACVSYYLMGNLENKKIDIEGVFAFGEIAFQLLNKTMVYVEIDEKVIL